MSALRPRVLPVLVAAPLAALVVALLAGCTPGPTPTESASPPPPSASASPTPEPSATPKPGSTPIRLTCDQLVSPETIYAFNPNFGPKADWRPAAGTPAADALAARGVACRWINQTSGDTLDVSVASFDSGTLTELKNRAFATSQMVPTYGEEAYFSVTNGVGTAIVFQGPYWLVASSGYFREPGEATDIVNAALDALR